MLAFNIISAIVGLIFWGISGDELYFALGFLSVWVGGIASEFLPSKKKPTELP